MNQYDITEQLFSRVKNFVNSQSGYFSRTELFKAFYGEEEWWAEASKPGHPLDICTCMLQKCGFFIRPTSWAGIWTKPKDIPSELTIQDLVEMFEKSKDED